MDMGTGKENKQVHAFDVDDRHVACCSIRSRGLVQISRSLNSVLRESLVTISQASSGVRFPSNRVREGLMACLAGIGRNLATRSGLSLSQA